MSAVKYDQGLIVGKFYPPHLGHKFLIDTALEQCTYVTVLVVENEKDTLDSNLRREWLVKMCPRAAVYVIEDINDDDNSEAWAKECQFWISPNGDNYRSAVFTSEDYGEPWAKALGVDHVLVDKERKNYPISATKVREDVLHNLNFLHPLVRSYFTKRIVFVGAESTGTTTLARYAAEHYDVLCVPEYGRAFCEGFPTMSGIPWSHDLFKHIAEQQQQMEDTYASISDGMIMCDTNALATTLWEGRYVRDGKGLSSGRMAAAAKADLYVITGDDIPFVQDGYRDGEAIRHTMHLQFIEMMNNLPRPFILAYGTVEERFAHIKPHIDMIRDREIVI